MIQPGHTKAGQMAVGVGHGQFVGGALDGLRLGRGGSQWQDNKLTRISCSQTTSAPSALLLACGSKENK